MFIFWSSLICHWQSRLRLPILLLATGRKDRYVRSRSVVRFFEKHAPGTTRIREYPTSLHGIDLEVPTISVPVMGEALAFADALVAGEIIAG